jgi:hypothetical protein
MIFVPSIAPNGALCESGVCMPRNASSPPLGQFLATLCTPGCNCKETKDYPTEPPLREGERRRKSKPRNRSKVRDARFRAEALKGATPSQPKRGTTPQQPVRISDKSVVYYETPRGTFPEYHDNWGGPQRGTNFRPRRLYA